MWQAPAPSVAATQATPGVHRTSVPPQGRATVVRTTGFQASPASSCPEAASGNEPAVAVVGEADSLHVRRARLGRRRPCGPTPRPSRARRGTPGFLRPRLNPGWGRLGLGQLPAAVILSR